MVIHLPPTSEVGGLNPKPYVGKLVVAYQLYVLVSSAHKTTRGDKACTVLNVA